MKINLPQYFRLRQGFPLRPGGYGGQVDGQIGGYAKSLFKICLASCFLFFATTSSYGMDKVAEKINTEETLSKIDVEFTTKFPGISDNEVIKKVKKFLKIYYIRDFKKLLLSIKGKGIEEISNEDFNICLKSFKEFIAQGHNKFKKCFIKLSFISAMILYCFDIDPISDNYKELSFLENFNTPIAIILGKIPFITAILVYLHTSKKLKEYKKMIEEEEEEEEEEMSGLCEFFSNLCPCFGEKDKLKIE